MKEYLCVCDVCYKKYKLRDKGYDGLLIVRVKNPTSCEYMLHKREVL